MDTLLTISFLLMLLKLFNLVTISWWVVFAPTLAGILIFIVTVISLLFFCD